MVMVTEKVKTTILLREDLHEQITREFGKKRLSEVINKLLMEELRKGQKNLFGIDKGMKPFNREHHERF